MTVVARRRSRLRVALALLALALVPMAGLGYARFGTERWRERC